MWGAVVVAPYIFVVNEERKWYNQIRIWRKDLKQYSMLIDEWDEKIIMIEKLYEKYLMDCSNNSILEAVAFELFK